MSGLETQLGTDLAGIFSDSAGPCQEITYTPDGGDAVTCNALVGPAGDEVAAVEDDYHRLLRRNVTVLIDDVGTPAPGDALTIGDDDYAVEAVLEIVESAFALLECVRVARQRAGTPGSYLETP